MMEVEIDGILVKDGILIGKRKSSGIATPVFTNQPTLDESIYASGDTVTLDLGVADGGAILSVETFTVGGVDKSGEIIGTTWTGTVTTSSTISFRVSATNAGGTTLSDTITATYYALWTPVEITTALWVDAKDTDTLTLAGSNVSQWDDKSGNDRHLIQSTSGLQATYDSSNSDLSGQPAVVNAQGKYWNAVTGFQRNFFIGVMSYRSGAATFNEYTFFDSTDSGSFGSPRILGQISQNTFFSGSAPTNFRKNGGVLQASTDAVLPLSADVLGFSYSLSSSSDMRLLGNPVATVRSFDGAVGELIILGSEPSEVDRQLLEGYLAHKWELTSKLPSDHPYKTTVPTV